MQWTARRQCGFDREETGKAVAFGDTCRTFMVGMAVVVVRMRGLLRMRRLRMRRMQVAAERHDRKMKNAHRPEQDDEAKAQEFAGREPMHKIGYKVAVPNCHHPVRELRELQIVQIN